uniref:Uncharacterized protein n=1 Tax=viral metagenome TaxID=1070528 RepID=A0A6C0J1M4_9ZZZZ
MYDKITNPKTKRKVNINSKLGMSIIKNYIDVLQTGGKFINPKCNEPLNYLRNFTECQKDPMYDANANDNLKVFLNLQENCTDQDLSLKLMSELYSDIIFKTNVKRENIFGIIPRSHEIKKIYFNDHKSHYKIINYSYMFNQKNKKNQITENYWRNNSALGVKDVSEDVLKINKGALKTRKNRHLLDNSSLENNIFLQDVFINYKGNYESGCHIQNHIDFTNKLISKRKIKPGDTLLYYIYTHGGFKSMQYPSYGKTNEAVTKVYEDLYYPIIKALGKTGTFIYIPNYCRTEDSNKVLIKNIIDTRKPEVDSKIIIVPTKLNDFLTNSVGIYTDNNAKYDERLINPYKLSIKDNSLEIHLPKEPFKTYIKNLIEHFTDMSIKKEDIFDSLYRTDFKNFIKELHGYELNLKAGHKYQLVDFQKALINLTENYRTTPWVNYDGADIRRFIFIHKLIVEIDNIFSQVNLKTLKNSAASTASLTKAQYINLLKKIIMNRLIPYNNDTKTALLDKDTGGEDIINNTKIILDILNYPDLNTMDSVGLCQYVRNLQYKTFTDNPLIGYTYKTFKKNLESAPDNYGTIRPEDCVKALVHENSCNINYKWTSADKVTMIRPGLSNDLIKNLQNKDFVKTLSDEQILDYMNPILKSTNSPPGVSSERLLKNEFRLFSDEVEELRTPDMGKKYPGNGPITLADPTEKGHKGIWERFKEDYKLKETDLVLIEKYTDTGRDYFLKNIKNNKRFTVTFNEPGSSANWSDSEEEDILTDEQASEIQEQYMSEINEQYGVKISETDSKSFDCKLTDGKVLRTAILDMLINIHKVENSSMTEKDMWGLIGGVPSGAVISDNYEELNHTKSEEVLTYPEGFIDEEINGSTQATPVASEVVDKTTWVTTIVNMGIDPSIAHAAAANASNLETAVDMALSGKVTPVAKDAVDDKEAWVAQIVEMGISRSKAQAAVARASNLQNAVELALTGGGRNTNLKNTYNTIINPITNKKLNLNTKSGRNLLLKFLNQQ